MKTLLVGLFLLVTACWAWNLLGPPAPSAATLAFALHQHGFHLSGLYAVAFLSLAVLLAAAPGWLVQRLGGSDPLQRTQRWAFFLALGFAAAHWLIEMSEGLLESMVGTEGFLPSAGWTEWYEDLQDAGEDVGEWAVYALLVLMAIALWRRFPGPFRRLGHRFMPFAYLLLAFHAAVLFPAQYWLQPAGILLIVLFAAGLVASAMSLAGRIAVR